LGIIAAIAAVSALLGVTMISESESQPQLPTANDVILMTCDREISDFTFQVVLLFLSKFCIFLLIQLSAKFYPFYKTIILCRKSFL